MPRPPIPIIMVDPKPNMVAEEAVVGSDVVGAATGDAEGASVVSTGLESHELSSGTITKTPSSSV